MTNKEINLRSIIFLIIGLLLILSLVICVYIVKTEKDLVNTKAKVVKVVEDNDGNGQNDVTVVYEVDGTSYNYNFYYKDNVKENDQISIYYHRDNVTAVQTYKTSYLIFICPIIGLILCIYGLISIFRRKNDNEEDNLYKTQVIGTVGDTQQLKIIIDEDDKDYETPEEQITEASIKPIKAEIKKEESQESPIDKIFEAKDTNFLEESNKKIITPKKYYVNNNVLQCELPDNTKFKIELKDIESIKKTVNNQEEIIKLVLANKNLICTLTQVKESNLYRTYNNIKNFIREKKATIKESIEHKEK